MCIKKTKFTPAIKNSIRKQYEHGEDLVQIAIKNKLSYSYLKTLASKEKWEKGKYSEKGYHEFLSKETEEEKKEREEIKVTYKKATGKLKNIMLEAMEKKDVIDKSGVMTKRNGFNKAEAESYKAMAQALECAYKIDKDNYDLRTGKENMDYQQEMVKFETLKKELLETDSEIQETDGILIRVVDESGGIDE